MNAVKIALYGLATFTCLACTGLLIRQYLQTRARLVMWSAICFVGLSFNNLLLFADLVLFPDVDLRAWRSVAALAGMMCLLYGFVWEAER